MGKYENLIHNKHPEIKPKNDRFKLSPFQIQEILSFPSQKNGDFLPFGALLNILNEKEQKTLTDFSHSLTESFSIKKNDVLAVLINQAKKTNNPEAQKILEKISQYVDYYLVTADDISDPSSFSQLPFELQLIISTCGKKIFSQLQKFLSNNGILTVLSFKKPIPNYIEAINQEYPQLSPLEKVYQAIHQPSKKIQEASHQFISLNFIPQSPDDKNEIERANHLKQVISPRVDKIEEQIAKIKLLEAILNDELKEVFISLLGSTLTIPLFYVLNNLGENNPTTQALIKIISHLTSNLINAYAQFKLWLEGDTNIEEIKDFFEKIARSPLFLSTMITGMGIDTISEIVGQTNPFFGSTIFGSEAVIGSLSTTIVSLKQQNHKEKHSFLKELKENPAALAMNLAALGTMMASIGVLGLADQFHNPAAIALVGQATEPILAAIFTKIIISNYSIKFKKEMEKKINKWAKKN
ncbi:MAG: hypothetical protein Fur009_7270 [Candidatus Microgenomates bacterium]